MPSGSPARAKVLWIDDEPEALEAAARALQGEPVEFVACADASAARDRISAGRFAAVVADQGLRGASGVDLLAHAKSAAPNAARMLVTGRVDGATAEAAVNRAAVFRFVSKPWDPESLRLDVRKAIEHHERAEAKALLLRESSVQNRRLEELATGLEGLVLERTRRAERSKEEAESKLARMRELVRFIKDLSTLVAVEELIELMRRELKSHHGLRAPALGYMAAERRPRLAYFQGKQALEHEARKAWPSSLRLRVNELEDRQYLADEFGRPFAKTVAVPLKRRASSGDGREPPAVLWFEHALPDDEIEPFLAFIGERAQPMAIALDRILLEHSLKAAAVQWAETFDGVRDPIAIVDVDFRIVRANRHFRSQPADGDGFGARLESRCHKVFAGLDSPCRGCPVREAFESGVPQRAQIRRGGRVYEARSYPIRLSGDSLVTNVINRYVDVTADRDLRSRLVQNEKMAAVGLLAGNIAHELNNPLTGIRSLAQVLLREIPEGSREREDLAEVEKAAARSQKIIENLLDFSIGGAERKQTSVELDEIVRRTLPMLKTALREHRTEIDLQAGAAGLVRAEPHLLQQVVFNLVNNACQAMRDPGAVTVQTAVVPARANEAQARVELRVRDVGPGVPSELAEAIFEPFFTTKPEGEGTGLGLSMSRQIIQQFGGDVRVEAAAGGGAEFVVSLPLLSPGRGGRSE